MAEIRVTATYASGIVRTWTSQDGDTEKNLRRRMRDARRKVRCGPGWMERDYTEPEPYVERIEWAEQVATSTRRWRGMGEAYTLTQGDVDVCQEILARLEELDAQTGGYRVGSVQGHAGSATATVHYARKPGPLATSEAVQYALDQVSNLGLLCKKVIAHCESHPEEVRSG